MALTKCEDCGHDVSTQAAACPNCGRPLNAAPAPVPAVVTSRPSPFPPPATVSAGAGSQSGTPAQGTSPKRSWFRRHPVLTVVLALIVVGAIGSAFSGGKSKPDSGSPGLSASNVSAAASTPTTGRISGTFQDASGCLGSCGLHPSQPGLVRLARQRGTHPRAIPQRVGRARNR